MPTMCYDANETPQYVLRLQSDEPRFTPGSLTFYSITSDMLFNNSAVEYLIPHLTTYGLDVN